MPIVCPNPTALWSPSEKMLLICREARKSLFEALVYLCMVFLPAQRQRSRLISVRQRHDHRCEMVLLRSNREVCHMSMKRIVWPAFELLVVGLVFCCSCTRTSDQDRSKTRFSDGAKKKYEVESDEKPFPAGPLMQDDIAFQFAIYYLPSPKGDPLDCLNELLQTEFKDLRWVHSIVRKGDSLDSLKELFQPEINGHRRMNSADSGKEGKLIEAKVINYVQTSYAPPNLELLQRFGHGLSQEQAKALQDSQTAMLLDFGYPKEHVWDGMRTALSLASRIARKTGGLLWDAETREVYTPDAWEMERIEGWTEVVPDIARHTVIRARNNGECSRMVTDGMSKFGLPDVVVDRFPWSLHRNMASLLGLFAQAMAEGGASKLGGEFDLDIRTIRNPSFREFQIMSLKANAASVALLSLREGTRQEFDPDNRIIEITFARYPGHDLHAQQQEMVGSLFSWEDSVKTVAESQE